MSRSTFRPKALVLLAAILVSAVSMFAGATAAVAGEWVQFPAGVFYCDWYTTWNSYYQDYRS
jgi:hypothetical protein